MIRPTLAAVMAALAVGVAGCGDSDGSADAAPPVPAAVDGATATVTTVTPSGIAERLVSGEVFLVDVREDDEWDAGRASFATHIPLAEVADRLDEIREGADGRPVAFICRTGRRSAEAAQIALDAGIDEVINIDGGMGAWVAAGLPIVPDGGRIL